jgi:hypothetical protein
VFALKQVALKGMKKVDREEAIDEVRAAAGPRHRWPVENALRSRAEPEWCVAGARWAG